MGVHRACFYGSARLCHPPGGNLQQGGVFLSCAFFLSSRTNWRALRKICLALVSWCAHNELKRPSASVLVVLARGVRGPDANGPVPHCAAPLPAPPRPTRPAATNSSPGACSASTPPSR